MLSVDGQPAYCRFDELPTVGPVLGREMVHHDVLLDDLHLHGGAVPHELETLPPWNLQHDWSHGVNIVTANTSFGESDHTARMRTVESDTDTNRIALYRG